VLHILRILESTWSQIFSIGLRLGFCGGQPIRMKEAFLK
jgi:hypothetical protein